MTEPPLAPVEEVLADLLALVEPLAAEEVGLPDALGRVLAQDVVAPHDVPGFDNSAMDGVAVRAADTGGASRDAPVPLRLVGASYAGGRDTPPALGHGQAATITTGAPVPSGADAVVRVEDTARDGDTVLVRRAVRAGDDVRRRGEDLAAGQCVLTAGTVLGPGQVAAAAGVGLAVVRVHRAPRVAVVLTGDEVVPGGAALGDHQVFDAVGPALAGLLRDAGAGDVRGSGPVADDPRRLAEALRAAADAADLVVTVGGVSKGARDHLAAVLGELGTSRGGAVALRPGKPFRYGRVGAAVVTCLPGNPGAALVAFEVFVRAVLAVQAGADPQAAAPLRATLSVPFAQRPGRWHWVRATVACAATGPTVRPVGSPGSAMLHGLAAADAWMVVPPDVERLEPGSEVDVRPMWGGRGRASWTRP